MLSRLFRKKSNDVARRDRTKKTRRSMRFEQLEGRQLMAVYNWTLGADGDFSNSSAWTGPNSVHQVPGPADDATIPGDVIVTSSGNSVNRIFGGNLRIAGGTFSTSNSVFDSSLVSLRIESGAALQVAGGTFKVTGGSEISGTIVAAPAATFRFVGGNNNINLGASMIGDGLFQIGAEGNTQPTVNLLTDLVAPTNLLFTGGVLTGPEDLIINGVFNCIQAGSSNPIMRGTGKTIVQSGATLDFGGAKIELDGRTLENSGQINGFTAGPFFVKGGGVINNLVGGVIDIKGDQGFDTNTNDPRGGFINNAGTIVKSGGSGLSKISSVVANTGTVDVQVGTLSIFRGSQNNAILKTAALTNLLLGGLDDNYTIEMVGTTNLQGNGSVFLDKADMTVNPAGATVNVPATTSFVWRTSRMTIPINAILIVNGTFRLNNATEVILRGGGTLRTVGEFIQEGPSNLRMTGDNADTVRTKIDIPVGKFLTLQNDSDILKGAGIVGGEIKNAGVIRKTSGTGTSSIDAVLQNSNYLTSFKGTLAVRNTNSTGGKYNTATNATIRLTDLPASQFKQDGTFTALGKGTISVGAGSITMPVTGAKFAIPATVNFNWDGGAFNVPIGAIATVNGNLSTSGTGDRSLNGGGTLRINGTLTHGAVGNFQLNASGGIPSTLHIPTTSVFAFTGDSRIVSSPTQGVLINEGSIRKNGGVGISAIKDITINSTGNFTSNVGTLQINSASGVLSGGTMDVANGAIIDLTGGATVNYTGTFTGSGTGEVRLANGFLNATGAGTGLTLDFPASLFRWSGGTIATNGLDVSINNQAAIVGSNNVTVSGGGTVHIAGTLNHQTQGNLQLIGTSTLHITPTGTYNIQSDGDLTGGTDTVVVEGTLRKNAGNGLSQISARVNNLGRVEARRGTLSITGAKPDIVGTDLAGGFWGVFSTAAVPATLNLNANITSIGLEASVTMSGPNSSFPSIANLASVAGSFQLLAGASFGSTGNLTNNGVITISATSVLDVSGNYTQNATGRLNTQMNDTNLGRIRTTGNVVLGGTLSIAHSGTQPAIASGLTLIENQGTLQVGGTFNGLPQLASILVNGMTFGLNYNSGTGANDTVLVRTA